MLKCLRTPKCTRLQDFADTISKFFRGYYSPGTRKYISFTVSGPFSWNALPPSLHDPSLWCENSLSTKNISVASGRRDRVTLASSRGGRRGANGGNCPPPQPAPRPVLRLMQIRWIFKQKMEGRGWSKGLMCLRTQSRTAVSMPWACQWLITATQSIATNSGADFIGHGGTYVSMQKNSKQGTGQTVLTITKALTKTTNCTFRQTSGGARPKKNFGAGSMSPLSHSFQYHWPQTRCESSVKAETILPLDRPTDRGFSTLALVKSKLHSTVGVNGDLKLCCWH